MGPLDYFKGDQNPLNKGIHQPFEEDGWLAI